MSPCPRHSPPQNYRWQRNKEFLFSWLFRVRIRRHPGQPIKSLLEALLPIYDYNPWPKALHIPGVFQPHQIKVWYLLSQPGCPWPGFLPHHLYFRDPMASFCRWGVEVEEGRQQANGLCDTFHICPDNGVYWFGLERRHGSSTPPDDQPGPSIHHPTVDGHSESQRTDSLWVVITLGAPKSRRRYCNLPFFMITTLGHK